jgi:hypothetical protein
MRDTLKHIHACRKREFLSLHPFSREGAQYCFECFQWYQSGSAWAAHCQLHLSRLTKICNVVRAEPQSLLITPGHCPFCLGTPGKPSRQWHQFQTWEGLLRHIDQHMADIDFPLPCPHPLCTEELHVMEDLENHFSATHGFEDFQAFRLKPLGKRQGLSDSTTQAYPCFADDATESDGETTPPSPGGEWGANGNISLSLKSDLFSLTPGDGDDMHIESPTSSSVGLPSLSELLEGDPDEIDWDVRAPSAEPSSGFKWNEPPALPQPFCPESSLAMDVDSSPCPSIISTTKQRADSSNLCPRCSGPLPEDLPPKLLVREKIERCPVCTQDEAEALQKRWRDKGYPEIDWDDLTRRINEHIPWLRECLKAKAIPVFREEYLKAMGLSITNLCEASSWHSGYYGPRGQDFM